MTKAQPLACNCKPGWVYSFQCEPTPSLAIARRGGFLSSFFLRQRTTTTTTSHARCRHLPPSAPTTTQQPTPSLAIARQGGFFHPFFKATNDNDNDEPCRLVVVICLHLHPRQRRQPTPSLAIARRGGFFSSFFQ